MGAGFGPTVSPVMSGYCNLSIREQRRQRRRKLSVVVSANAIHPMPCCHLWKKLTCAAIFQRMVSKEASDILFTPHSRSLSASPSNSFMRTKLTAKDVEASTMTSMEKRKFQHQPKYSLSILFTTLSPPCRKQGIISDRFSSLCSTLHLIYKCTALAAEHHVPTTA